LFLEEREVWMPLKHLEEFRRYGRETREKKRGVWR